MLAFTKKYLKYTGNTRESGSSSHGLQEHTARAILESPGPAAPDDSSYSL